MVNHQYPALQNCFAEHINSAYKVLKHSFRKIPELFDGKEICVMDYIMKEQKEKAIEIRFDTATLTCTFDEDDFCDYSFLFLDNLEDLHHYVDYCNRTYKYDYIRRAWIVEDYCLEIRVGKDDYFLHFFAMLPLFSRN
jgi:hypothetical protein